LRQSALSSVPKAQLLLLIALWRGCPSVAEVRPTASYTPTLYQLQVCTN